MDVKVPWGGGASGECQVQVVSVRSMLLTQLVVYH